MNHSILNDADQNPIIDNDNELQPIKCSLCSTPRKIQCNPFDDGCYDTDDVYDDDTAAINQSNYLSIMPSDLNPTCQSIVQPHADHCANRLIVRIFATSK